MHPVLFSIGPVTILAYSTMIAIGILAGTWLTMHLSRHKGQVYQDRILEFATYAVFGAIAGARIWEMIWVWGEYAETPWKRIAFWEGGMSIQGAILGGVITAVIYSRVRRLPMWQFLDDCAPGLVLGQGIGRIGCLFNGDAFGVPVEKVAWWPKALGVVYAPGTPAHDVYGSIPLVPAEALEGLADFGICALLVFWRPKNRFDGWRTLTYGALYSAVRFFLEYLRSDSLLLGGLKVAQVSSFVALLFCAALYWHRLHQSRQTTLTR